MRTVDPDPHAVVPNETAPVEIRIGTIEVFAPAVPTQTSQPTATKPDLAESSAEPVSLRGFGEHAYLRRYLDPGRF